MEPRPIELHPEALAEAIAARQWYSEIDPSLGESFSQELDHAIDRIERHPERWSQHMYRTRIVSLGRFPYFVVYRLHSEKIQVVAISHVRRRPGYWQERR